MKQATQDILTFWFGAWPYDQTIAKHQAPIWFQSSNALDLQIKQQFESLVESALCGEFSCDSIDDEIAYIILLDQFTRNIYRGQGKAFSGDQLALDKCLHLITRQQHLQLPLNVAIFICMPLQHSEDSDIHQQSITVFSQLADMHGEAAKGFLDYAQQHKAIIDEFSRYPHRNQAMGRNTTAEEETYLNNHGQRFGQ
ncbi:MAG: hypothetical protein ACI8SR_001261 [Oceanicoccus sp.]|jgi:uncharacterized protein (DUF924 family)